MRYSSTNRLQDFEFHDAELSLISWENNRLIVSAKFLNIHKDAAPNNADTDMEISEARITFSGFQIKEFEPSRTWNTDENGNTYNVTNASEDGGSITIPNCSSDNSPDITLTYHEGEGGALLEIYVVTGDIRELVFNQRVKEGTYVNPQYDGAGKLIITIRHNNDGVDEPKPNDVIEVKIDGTYRGDMEYPINQDTVLELMIA